MCLNKILPIPKKYQDVEGWKVVNRTRTKSVVNDTVDERWKPLFYGRTSFPFNKWIRCRSTKRINVRKNYQVVGSYQSGFHFFTSYVDAHNYEENSKKIMKVKARDIVAYGYQGRRRVLVARQIFVIKPEAE